MWGSHRCLTPVLKSSQWVDCPIIYPSRVRGVRRFRASCVSAACVGTVSCVTVWRAPDGFYAIFRVFVALCCFSPRCGNIFNRFITGLILAYAPHAHTLAMHLNQEQHDVNDACVWGEERGKTGRQGDRKPKICGHKTWGAWRGDELWARSQTISASFHRYSFSKCHSQGRRKWVNSPFNTGYIRGN